MSLESAKQFIERMKNDTDFAKQVTACADAQERMALVKTEGYEFTQEEIGQIKEQLSDEELDNITGGGCICADIWCGIPGESCARFF